MRGFDRDLIRGGHYGQRPLCAALTGRTHGCTDQPANVKKTLANSEPSTHGTKLRRAARLRRSANRGIADYAVGDLHVLTGDVGRARLSHHSRRPRKRSCDSMTDSSSCARSSPTRPRLGLFVRSLSIRRSAAATRSRARSKSATVYCRGFGRVRFLRGPFAALLARMAALSCFPVAIGATPIFPANPANQTYSSRRREPSRA